jgi:uncharacterized membrane protein
MPVFKVLHILCMFTAVTLLVGEHFFYAVAVRRRDVRALAAIRRLSVAPFYIADGAPVVAIGFLLAGVVFGLLTALTGGFDFFAGWLIAAYVLVAGFLVLGGSPWVRRLARLGDEAVEAETGGRPAEEVIEHMAGSHAGLLFAIAAGLMAAIIVDMVLKPF